MKEKTNTSKGRNYKQGRHKKGDRRPDYREDDRLKRDAKEVENDASWYTRNQALIADAGKIAFSWPLGVPVDLEYDTTLSGTYGGNDIMFDGTKSAVHPDDLMYYTPGVMALKYVPTYGIGHNGYDPLNIAAQNIYTYVRHVQSGHANYDPNDLTLYLLAMDQIYTLWMHCARAYGTIRLFSQVNRSYPKVIMNAMGFDYDDISKNLASFRYFLNNAVARIGAMVVPNVMPLFARHMWMPSTLFTDGPSNKAQIYLFRPQAFGIYNEKTATTGGFLEAQFFDGVRSTADWMTLLDSMISAVRSSEDCGIISGDILKAFGDNVIKLPELSNSYTTAIAFSPEVLGQIANATIIDHPAYGLVPGTNKAGMLYQDLTNNILASTFKAKYTTAASTEAMKAAVQLYGAKHVMVGLSEQPTPEEVMVNSRLMVFGRDFVVDSNTGAISFNIDSCGSEIITQAAMYDTFNLEGYFNSGTWWMNRGRYFGYVDALSEQDTADDVYYELESLATMNFFNMHPAHFCCFSDQTYNRVSNFFDVDNYAVLNAHDVAKMHETALLSMLDVPLMGMSKAK